MSMTGRQKFLKAVYPLLNVVTKLIGKNNRSHQSNIMSKTSFYNLSAELNNQQNLSFETFKGKKVLIVNTASDCGYTRQYDDLEKLYEQYAGQIEVIGFPANDFGEQEKGSDAEIAEFCKINFGVTFPLAKKSTVIKNEDQHPVYRWLSHEAENGWNNSAPTWNFCKYLINEEGNLTHFFEASIEPMSDDMKNAIVGK